MTMAIEYLKKAAKTPETESGNARKVVSKSSAVKVRGQALHQSDGAGPRGISAARTLTLRPSLFS